MEWYHWVLGVIAYLAVAFPVIYLFGGIARFGRGEPLDPESL